MTVVNPKSISGINSITTGSGSDNLLTIHRSDASSTERVRINSSGDVIVGSGITVSPDGDIFATGVTTATTFVGALTGNVTGTASANAVLTGSTNNTVTTVTGANAIQGESALTFDGNTLTISAPSNDTPFIVDTASTNGAHLRFQKDGSNQHFVGAGGGFSLGDREDLSLRGYDNILFASGNSSTERMRIASDGKVGINIAGSDNTSPVRNLDIADSSGAILRLISTDDSLGANERVGEIEFFTDDDDASHVSSFIKAIADPSDSFGRRGSLTFGTRSDSGNGTEKIRILHSGGITFNGDTAAANALDDYEEGTFAPMTSTLAEVYHARYTKIGNLVTINTCFEMKSGQARNYIELPFLPNNDNAGANDGLTSSTNNRYAGTVSFFDSGVNAVNIMLFHQGNQGSSAYFLAQSSSGTQTWPRDINDDFGKVGVSMTYQTAS